MIKAFISVIIFISFWHAFALLFSDMKFLSVFAG